MAPPVTPSPAAPACLGWDNVLLVAANLLHVALPPAMASGAIIYPLIDGGGTGSSRAACFLSGLLQILELSIVASFNCKFVYRMLGSLQNSQTNPKPSTELLMQWVPGRQKGPWEQRIP